MFPRPAPILGLVVLLLVAAAPARAQDRALASPGARRSLRAVEVAEPPSIDGVLDEPVWTAAEPATDFVQADPLEGQPATERTEVRVAFDHDFLYIAARCLDSDPSGVIVNEIRKDFVPREQDAFEVLLDTFLDRRNGFVFSTNAAGARADTQIANEGREVNTNWDAVWWVAAARNVEGWAAEFKIPFKTLRYEGGPGHDWGINFARRIRRKNEVTYWSPVSRAFSIFRASSEGDLTGLPPLNPGRNIRVKPFLLGGATRAVGGEAFDGNTTGGVDVKVGVTPSMALDLTVNPDFAQAEADEQQVNLTQFSLFFPEKREFFLENSGIFYFGDIPRNARQPSRFRPPEEDLLLFFSRRIGLTESGEQLPLHGGVRLTGRAGAYGLGLMTMQGEAFGARPGENYTVARVRRDVLANSDIGAIIVSRDASGRADDFNRVYGVDANFRFVRYFNVNGFAARSDTPGERRNQATGKLAVGWEDSLKRLQASVMHIGEGFRDDLGFVRRTGVLRTFFDWAWMPQPERLRRRGIRQVQPHARVFSYYNPSSDIVSRTGHAGVQITWNNGAIFEYAFEPRTEAITTPFRLRPDIAPIPVGRYDWRQHLFIVETDHSRAFSGSLRFTSGGFWSGTQRNAQASLLYRPNSRLVFDAGIQVSDIALEAPAEQFTTTLVNLRSGYAFNTNMFLDSLLQYRTDVKQFSANIRFNLIHRPLSDLFVVYNDQQYPDRDIAAGRAVVVKYTHMFAF
ncbi:MAG: carbohydrate binding family 9 domain-containing protein [Acidobacteria bacterium]|nr:carbohydrate binding family 9 domain-containing protein [Acidobacteriota bacterium]